MKILNAIYYLPIDVPRRIAYFTLRNFYRDEYDSDYEADWVTRLLERGITDNPYCFIYWTLKIIAITKIIYDSQNP